MPATTWHRLGTKDELLARVPFAIKIERHRIAVFLHEGRFTALPAHRIAHAPHDTQSVYLSETFHGVVTIESYPTPMSP